MIDVAHAPVRHYATIDSTNTEARRLYEAGERGPVWILADEQTAGRGRLDRYWVSEVGNLYCTLLYPTEMTAERVPQLGFAVALAVADVANQHASNVQLKWPNDVLVGGAKVSGILCEVLAPSVIAIGCGINIAHAPAGLPYATTYLAGARRDEAFQHFRERLAHWLEVWQHGFVAVREAWLSRALGIGERVTMTVGSHTHHGMLSGIDEHGALMLKRQDNSVLTLHAGDLVIPSLQALRKQTA